MNWIDALILLIFCFFVYEDFHRGFLRLVADLIGLVLAFIIAVYSYADLGAFLINHFGMKVDTANPLGFLIIWLAVQIIFYVFSKMISRQTSMSIKGSKLNKYLAIVPAMIKGALFITIVMILIVAMPIDQKQKKFFTESSIGQLTLSYAVKGEAQMEKVFGGSNNDAIASRAEKNINGENVPLKFSTTNFVIDEEAEKLLLDKVNEERLNLGLSPLRSDILIRNVARAHAADMLIRGYFSHDEPDGQNLFLRYNNANVSFTSGGENLALAPTIDLVHLGLMNSKKHKDNILSPEYSRAGIGVLNAGPYGLMVVEDFAN